MAEFTVTTDLSVIENTQITANFEEVMAAVTELCAPYENMVVPPDGVATAKADRARLNKLAERIDDQRKAVKKVYEGQYKVFEAKCKPITDKIKGAAGNLDRQIKAAEEAEVTEKLAELRRFFDEQNKAEGAGFADFDKIAAAHPKWKNKGYELKAAQNDIILELTNIERGIKAMRGYPETYRAAMLEKFGERYDLASAINVYTQIKRREETERMLARQEEERRRSEEAARAARTAQEQAKATEGKEPAAEPQMQTDGSDGREGREAGVPAEEAQEPVNVIDFRVWATRSQLKALRVFLLQNGIKYGKVPKEEQDEH